MGEFPDEPAVFKQDALGLHEQEAVHEFGGVFNNFFSDGQTSVLIRLIVPCLLCSFAVIHG